MTSWHFRLIQEVSKSDFVTDFLLALLEKSSFFKKKYSIAKSGRFRSDRVQAVKCRGEQISWFLNYETYLEEKVLCFFFFLTMEFPFCILVVLGYL